MFMSHRPLVGTQEPPLEQRCDPMHPGQQLRSLLPAAPQDHYLPLVALLFQPDVAAPAVSVDRASGLDTILDEWVQARRRGIGDHPHPNPPDTRPVHLCGYRSEEHTSELQSLRHLVCRLLLEK